MSGEGCGRRLRHDAEQPTTFQIIEAWLVGALIVAGLIGTVLEVARRIGAMIR